ncbi:MAG: hypothetical protein ACO3NK_12530, partial [Prochlorotrichaceae cyanobacterium]
LKKYLYYTIVIENSGEPNFSKFSIVKFCGDQLKAEEGNTERRTLPFNFLTFSGQWTASFVI